MSMGVEARCCPSKSAAHHCHMKRQPFLHGHPCHGHLLCHCRHHLQLQLCCCCRCCCRHRCRRNRPSPLPLPWAVAAVAVNHCRHHLCCIAVSHRCSCRPCRQTLPSPSLSAITFAISVGHLCCYAVGHFRELLPWRGKNCIQQAKNAYLILFCWDSGLCIDQSRITYQVLSGVGQHQRWAASSEK
jgi:hypothetical protein